MWAYRTLAPDTPSDELTLVRMYGHVRSQNKVLSEVDRSPAILAWIDTEAIFVQGSDDHRRQKAVDLIVDNVEWQRLMGQSGARHR